jgi:hypothetical protein
MPRKLDFNGASGLQERIRTAVKLVVSAWYVVKASGENSQILRGRGVMFHYVLPCKRMVSGRSTKFICDTVMRWIQMQLPFFGDGIY